MRNLERSILQETNTSEISFVDQSNSFEYLEEILSVSAGSVILEIKSSHSGIINLGRGLNYVAIIPLPKKMKKREKNEIFVNNE
jgi:hypothetical protein